MATYSSYQGSYGQAGQQQQADPPSSYSWQNSGDGGVGAGGWDEAQYGAGQSYDHSQSQLYGSGQGAESQYSSSQYTEQETGGYDYNNQQWYGGVDPYQSSHNQDQESHNFSSDHGYQSYGESSNFNTGNSSSLLGNAVDAPGNYSVRGTGRGFVGDRGMDRGGGRGGAYRGTRGRGGWGGVGVSGRGGLGDSTGSAGMNGRGRGFGTGGHSGETSGFGFSAINRGGGVRGRGGVGGRGRASGNGERGGFRGTFERGIDYNDGFGGEENMDLGMGRGSSGFVGSSRGAGGFGGRGGEFGGGGRGYGVNVQGRGANNIAGGRGRVGSFGEMSGGGDRGRGRGINDRGRGIGDGGRGRGINDRGRGIGGGDRGRGIGGGDRGRGIGGGDRGRGIGGSDRGRGIGVGYRGRGIGGGDRGRGMGGGDRGRGIGGGDRGRGRGGNDAGRGRGGTSQSGRGRGGPMGGRGGTAIRGGADTTKTSGAAKRKGTPGGPPAKRGAIQDPHSLVPKKYVITVMKHSDPLIAKLAKLKQLLKEEGITKLHIVPKIDQLGCKAAIIIENVYRFASVPIPGYEDHTPVYCELYMDKMLMASGDCDTNRNAAMRQAYEEFTHKIKALPMNQLIANVSRGFMWDDPTIYTVVEKKHQEDNDSLFTTNLANLRQMMQCEPNLTLTLDKFVLMEFESDMETQNSYKKLELSATRNTVLLECEIVRNPDQRYTCLISMQGKILCSRINNTKNSAKRSCSDNIVKELGNKCDIVHVARKMDGTVHYRSTLMAAARKYRAEGIAPLRCALKKEEVKVTNTSQDIQRTAAEIQKSEEIEARPENVADKPYLPWLGRALADLLLDYHKQVSLEDFRVHINDMPKSMRDAVQVVAMKMGLKMVSKFKETTDNAVLRRPIPALEVTKMLALNNGTSGRLSMKQVKHVWPEEELKTFKQEYVAKYSKMYNDLLNMNEVDGPAMEV